MGLAKILPGMGLAALGAGFVHAGMIYVAMMLLSAWLIGFAVRAERWYL